MEKLPPKFVQNNPYKFKEIYPQKTNIAFVCSLFIYISIFYIFNLSPSKLFSFNSRLILFFLSNTLIIIILVDYGAFSSSSKSDKHNDIYHEDTMRRYYYKNRPSLRRNYSHGIRSSSIPEEDVTNFHDHEKILSHVNDNEMHEKKLESTMEGNNNNIKVKTIPYRRSISDGAKRVVFDESKNIVRRVERIVYELPSDDDRDEESNKYANMSNEEINRRVEDFIQRFNKQIRLQRDV